MGRSKQNKQNKAKETAGDGKQYRRETKEERKERLRLQQEAREVSTSCCWRCFFTIV